jgi:hypothetical protein
MITNVIIFVKIFVKATKMINDNGGIGKTTVIFINDVKGETK